MNFLFSLIFYLLALIVAGSTAMAVTRRNEVHAVVYLVASFFGTALLFYLLGAPLLAALEVIIYAGAIMVLFLFIVMTRKAEKPVAVRLPLRQWGIAITFGGICLLGMAVLIFAGATGGKLAPAMASPTDFGRFLFEYYWLPVELVSFLLFVGLVGALYLGRRGSSAPRTEREKETA
ncbi:MAG: NADH-quinone oxidoreductase subunit J [Syntrophobacteraceae bacterium]|nr:NADH-quinone oxidoreductase subunit J [Desulfobacteraceae bacterium]